MHRKLKRDNEGVWDYISCRAHILIVTDWSATEKCVSLFCRGFQIFKYFIIFLSLGQILQLGNTFYFFNIFYIDWSYEETERRKEKKEEDG